MTARQEQPIHSMIRQISSSGQESALFIRVDGRLGNFVMAARAAAELAGQGISTGLVHAARLAPLMKIVPGVCSIPHDKRWWWTNPPRAAWFVRELRRWGRGRVIDASRAGEFSRSHALLARLSGSQRRMRLAGPGADAWVDQLIEPSTPNEPERALQLAAAVHPAISMIPMPFLRVDGRLIASAMDIRPAGADWRGDGAGPPAACLYPGGRKADHHWPLACWIELGRALLAHGALVWLGYGPGEENLVRELSRGLGAGDRAWTPPLLPAADLAAQLSRTDLFIGGNTGPMHLAHAAGATVLGLFVREPGERWGYRHPPHRVLEVPQLADSRPAISAALEMIRAR
ncbi:MAG: hypothetical protein GMKNLPBB_01491 [Myxococcota bacterium]|nr:hypothetical protein [Myxococcota bacterium]